jgi:hypothetical protein
MINLFVCWLLFLTAKAASHEDLENHFEDLLKSYEHATGKLAKAN